GVHGGDQLPWVQVDSGRGADNFAPLRSLDWQVDVYGEGSPGIRARCAELHLAPPQFAWGPPTERAGLHRNALYLVRPDGYVALAAADPSAAALADYLDARAIRFPPQVSGPS